MTTTTLFMMLNMAMPTLMAVGLIATLFPLAVLLLIRRRSRRLSWGAMWLVQETLRRHAPLKLLRVLLLVVRSAVLPIAAAAIVGLWLLGDGSSHDRPRLIIVDDAIGAWITGADGRCAMDDHIDTLERLEAVSNDPLHGVLLSGRVLPAFDVDHVRALQPVASGPDWPMVMNQVGRQAVLHGLDQVLLLSDLRSGTLLTLNTEFIPGVTIQYQPPVDAIRETVRIVGVDAPRDVLLPGDPFRRGQLVITLDRSTATMTDQTEVQVDLIGVDGSVVDERHSQTFLWQLGEHRRQVFIPLHVDDSGDGLLHVHVAGSSSPAAQWWVRVQQHTSAEVTMLTGERKHTFDPTSSASWLAAAVTAGSPELTVRWLDHHDLQVDALQSKMPLIIIEPQLLSSSTWSALVERIDAGPTLVIPPIDAAPSWLDNFLESVGDTTLIGGLPITHREIDGVEAELGRDSGPLQLLSSELQTLLHQLHIERIVDLGPLVDSGVGTVVVSIDSQPLFVQINGFNTIVSALAWHPSWSDLPVRSAAPAILQELIRSKSSVSRATEVMASSPDARTAGPRSDGVLVQPDVAAADQARPDETMLRQLEAAGWITDQADITGGSTRAWTTRLAIVLLLLLALEILIAHIIDRHRVNRPVPT